jgi:hypothetical protein
VCVDNCSRRRRFRTTVVLLTGAALSLGCHVHRAAIPPGVDERVVLLRQDWSLPATSSLVEIRETASGQVRGRMQVTSGDVNRQAQERAYGCHMTRTANYGSGGSGWACEVPFIRGAPDWRAVLARLDSLGVNTPPAIPAQPVDGLRYVCPDGTHWAIEVRPGGGKASIRHASACGPRDSQLVAFEAGVESVLDTIERTAHVR